MASDTPLPGYCGAAAGHPFHGPYHDREYGFPLPKEERARLFRKTFRFTGGEITGEFLISTGYLPGAHAPECPVFDAIAKLGPPWKQTE